jgi:hypothetical protein
MNDLSPSDPQPDEPVDDHNASPAHGRESNRRPRAVEILAGAAVLSTTALLPLIDPKNPPFRGD